MVSSLFMAALISSQASAQGVGRAVGEEVDVTTQEGQQWRFILIGGAEYQFETDLEAGSDFSVSRYGGGIAAQTDLSRDFSMAFQAGYTLDLYDFNTGALGVAPPAEPWDNIHTLTITAIFSLDLNNDWTLFGGPLFQSSREANADFGDSISAGGAIGVTYKASRDLIIGGGVAVVSQIEEEARIVPIIVVDWKIASHFRLRNTSTGNVANRTGLELVYEASQNWEFAFGAASQYSRFRLDDIAPAPGGVGEDSSIPLWLRASYMPSQQVQINGVVGVNSYGELELHNASGVGIAQSDYDTAFFVGVFGTFRF
jgi:hypothetical protein